MEYKLLSETETEKEMEISVPRIELDRLIDEETERVKKGLAIKGYRKGRVPRALVKSLYGDTLKVQAMDRLIKRSYSSVLQEKKWRPAGKAELKEVGEADPITFRFFIEVIPEYDVENYLNIEVFKEPSMPDSFLLEQGMNALKEQYATVRDVDRPAVVDDLVNLDIEIQTEGHSDQKNDQTLRIGDRSLPDEFNRALVGTRAGERKEFRAGDHSYKIQIKSIKERILPEIDQEFASRMKFASVDDLTKRLLERMQQEEQKRLEDEMKESLSDVLLQRTKFTVPNSLIQGEYEKILKDYGLPDSEPNKERFWAAAEKRIRFHLILEKIAEKEKLRVTEAEIMDLIDKLGMKLTEENRSDVIDYIGTILSREKTLTFLYEHAKVSEKSRIISPKEAASDTDSVRH